MDTKNVIAAISLSAAVIILYGLFFAPSPQKLNQIQEEKNQIIQSSETPSLEVDEKITQASTGAVGKVVEWDSTRTLLYFQQERFGDYGTNSTTGDSSAFTGANLITGATSSATLTPSTDSETITLANNNTITTSSGYTTPELAADSGSIIYLENRKPIQRDSDQTEDIKLIIEF